MVTTTIHRSVSTPDEHVAASALRLYDAECALHCAHQTGVDEWIAAAADALHTALARHRAALAQAGHRRRRAA